MIEDEDELEVVEDHEWFVLSDTHPNGPARHTDIPTSVGWWCNLNICGIEAATALEVTDTPKGHTILEWAPEPTLVRDLPESQKKPDSWAGPYKRLERIPQKPALPA